MMQRIFLTMRQRMEKNEVSETAGQADYASADERDIARKISREAAKRVFELSLITEFKPLKDYEGVYEISRNYPHQIRRIKGKPLKESGDAYGYLRVYLNGKSRPKHRLIAL